MKLLLIEYLLRKSSGQFNIVIISSVCLFFVTLATFIDLAAGIYKAKQRGEAITSEGRKKTVSKLVLYFSLVFLSFFSDEILCYSLKQFYSGFPSIPLLTVAVTLYIIIGVEIRSIKENADEKHKNQLKKDVVNLAEILLKIKDKEIIEYLKNISKNTHENT